MYRIFGFLGIRCVRGISVGVHATGVSVPGGGVVGGVVVGCCSSVFAGDCRPLGPGGKASKMVGIVLSAPPS